MLLNLISYDGALPELAGPVRAARAGHALVGRVTLGRDAWLGAGSVLRADGHFVRVGDDFRIGRGATVHIAHGTLPAVVGHRVTAGANTVIHACTLGDDVVLEDDCVVLDGAEIGAGSVLEAGSIVYPRAVLPAGMLCGGRPARVLRELTPEEHRQRADALRARNEAADSAWPMATAAAQAADDAFVAGTAWLAGDVRLAAGSSIWYGCRLDARDGPITLGARCNVQDNSVLVGGAQGLVLGEGTTVGHNVEIHGATVGARCLVGIGSRLAPGTVVGDDAFVAAGSVTTPGQVLAGGQVWAGAPARAIGELDARKREMVQLIAVVYREYARVLSEDMAAG